MRDIHASINAHQEGVCMAAKKRKARDDEDKKESLSGRMEGKQTKRKKETKLKEFDEISLQLEEEKRKALEILSSLCTTDAHSSADEEHQPIDTPRGSEVGVVCKTTPKKVTFKEGDVAGKTVSKEGGVACKTILKVEVAGDKTTPKEEVACKTEGDTVECNEEDIKQMGSSFSVNTDLKQLFSSTCRDGGGGGFSFLSDEQVGNYSTETSKTESHENAEPSMHSTLDAEEMEVQDIDVPKYFFFHCDTKPLKNRIDENSFYRTESLEDLEAEWPARREVMKQSFRRRHKDALKRK